MSQHKILNIAQQEFLRLEDIKNYLRISHDYDDIWLLELINSAIEASENFLRKHIIARTIESKFYTITNYSLELPFSPVFHIDRVVTSYAGQNIICSPENYILNDQLLKFQKLSRFEYITVIHKSGYEDQSLIPAAIKQGIMLHVAQMYDSHGTSSAISAEVGKLYQPYRKMRV
ncbi:MAG: phage head-tail connector protein [Rickettsiaceae bacterium]|nr:phage head-tail connector protein [Rickettsiaceae bacterium]